VGDLPARERATVERALRWTVRADSGLCVLTGGQTGIDTMAAVVALRAGLPVHQVFPRGFLQEDGPLTMARRAELIGAAMHQLGSAESRSRTWTCAYLADAVILVDPAGGDGCQETARAAKSLGRPLLGFGLDSPATADLIFGWLAANHVRVLMVAGCRASQLAGSGPSAAYAQNLVSAIVAAARRWRDDMADGALRVPVGQQELGARCVGEEPHRGARRRTRTGHAVEVGLHRARRHRNQLDEPAAPVPVLGQGGPARAEPGGGAHR
jgi:hypothetical protein